MMLYLGCLMELIALIFAVISYAQQDKVFRLFYWNLVVVVVNEIVVASLIKIPGRPRMIANASINVYFLTEIWLISMAGLSLIKNINGRRLLQVCLAVFTVVWGYFFCQDGFRRLLIPAVLTGDIIGAMIFLVLIINMIGTGEILKQPLFWVSLGYLIFYCCNIPYFGMLFYIYSVDEKLLEKIRIILFSINIVRYSLTAYSFFLLKKQKNITSVINA